MSLSQQSGGPAQSPREPGVSTDRRWLHAALSAFVLATIAVGTLEYWQVMVARDAGEAALLRARVGKRLHDTASRALEDETVRLTRVAATLGKGQDVDSAAFDTAIAAEGMSRYDLAVAFVGPDGVIRHAWSAAPDSGWVRGVGLSKTQPWNIPLSRLQIERHPRMARSEKLNERAELSLAVAAVGSEGTPPPYRGAVLARLNLWQLMGDWMSRNVPPGCDFDLSDGGVVLVAGGRPIMAEDETTDIEHVAVFNSLLKLRVRAPAALAGTSSRMSSSPVVWGGMGLAVALSALVWWALRRQARRTQEACRQLAAIETLTQHAGTISTSPGAGREALNRLARSAREFLRMRIALIGMVDDAFDRIEVLAGRVGEAQRGKRVYSLAELRATRDSLERHETVVVEDWVGHPTVNQKAMDDLGSRSGMFVPLVVENRSIGLLFLGDSVPRRYKETERRLARALGSLAAVVLANLRLNDQKDAALAAQQEMARRHESLYAISTEIFRSEDLERSLQRLADSAPAVVDVDVCMVSLRTGRWESTVAAVTGNQAGMKGEKHDATRSNAGRVWETREPLVIEDGPADASLHPAFRHRLHVGSIMYLPLIGSGGDAIGTLALIRHATGAFAPGQVDLARVLAARAAIAIETAKLHDAERRAAQTHAMLLRELNHRVKNNLASIVSLLAMDRPASLDGEALDWLNRVSDRIATMARTHELFVGGKDRVDLRTLIAQLLPALALVKSPGVRVISDLGDLEVELGTERAVSLAMVLNELCWNALEHGTPDNGVLRIRGRGIDGGQFVVEVEDEGRGPADDHGPADVNGEGGAAVSQLRGTGLKLVEGLVANELRGSFETEYTPAGGTLARITIPLAEGESARLSL